MHGKKSVSNYKDAAEIIDGADHLSFGCVRTYHGRRQPYVAQYMPNFLSQQTMHAKKYKTN